MMSVRKIITKPKKHKSNVTEVEYYEGEIIEL